MEHIIDSAVDTKGLVNIGVFELEFRVILQMREIRFVPVMRLSNASTSQPSLKAGRKGATRETPLRR